MSKQKSPTVVSVIPTLITVHLRTTALPYRRRFLTREADQTSQTHCTIRDEMHELIWHESGGLWTSLLPVSYLSLLISRLVRLSSFSQHSHKTHEAQLWGNILLKSLNYIQYFHLIFSSTTYCKISAHKATWHAYDPFVTLNKTERIKAAVCLWSCQVTDFGLT